MFEHIDVLPIGIQQHPSYTIISTLLRSDFGDSPSLVVVVKMVVKCRGWVVEADSHIKLLSTSTWDINKCLSTLICCPLAYISSLTQLYPPYLDQILVVLGNLMWSQNDVIMSRSKLTATSNCFLHPHETLKKVWAHCCAVHWHKTDSSSLTQL